MAVRSRKSRKASKSSKASKSTKSRTARWTERHHEGPAEWLMPMMEEAYSRLRPKDEPEEAPRRGPARAAKRGVRLPAFRSVHRAGQGEEVLAPLPLSYWEDVLREYQRRKAAIAGPRPARSSMVIRMPVAPGAN